MPGPKFPVPKKPSVPMMPADHVFPEGWPDPVDPKKRQEQWIFQQWRETKDPVMGQHLMNSIQPVLNKRVNEFARGAPIPRADLLSYAQRLAHNALQKWSPEHGTQLNTWLVNNLKGMRRYVINNQNIVRVAEDRASLIGDERVTRDQLREELGREPSFLEVADRMNESPERLERKKKIRASELEKLHMEMKKDNISSAAMEDPFVSISPRERDILRLVRYELSPEEMSVYQEMITVEGRPNKLTKGEVARKLGWSPSKVSAVLATIAAKIAEFQQNDDLT